MEFLSLEDYPCLQKNVNELCGNVIRTVKTTGDCLQKELGIVMVSTENCIVVGFILLSPVKSKQGVNISVKRFEVLDECRREGWDKMLLLEAEKRARKLGHTQITVEESLCKVNIFQDMGYSSKKDTSGEKLRKRLVLQRLPVYSKPLALLQQLCHKLTLVEEKNAGKKTWEATLLIVPWIQQLSGAGSLSGLVCSNMASIYTVQPRAVKCILKKDERKHISLERWNLCNLKMRKMDQSISEGRFDENTDSKNKTKMKSSRSKNSKGKLRKAWKSSSFSLSKETSAPTLSLTPNTHSRSNSVDQAVLKDAQEDLPESQKNSLESFRRATYDFAYYSRDQNTDYGTVSSPAVIDLLTESTTGIDLIVTRSVSSSPTREISMISHSFSCSYDETVAVGPPAENDCWIPRGRSNTHPANIMSSIVTRKGPSKTLPAPRGLGEFDRHEPLIKENQVYATEYKWDKDEIVPILPGEQKKPIRDKNGKLPARESSSYLFGWTSPAPMRGAHIVEQTTESSRLEEISDRDLFARDLVPRTYKSRSSCTLTSSKHTPKPRVQTPDPPKWARADEQYSEPRYGTTPATGWARHPLKKGYKRRSSRHKRTSSFPFLKVDGGADVLRAKGEAETGPAEPLGDTVDLVTELSALADRRSEVKDQQHPRFKGGLSLTNVPQIPEDSELFSLLPPLIEAQRALDFGYLKANTKPSLSKFKKSRELLQNLLRELREVLPKESQRERINAMATCGWNLMKIQRALKSQVGKQIDSRSIAKLYNNGDFGLHVKTLSFDTDLIRHYVVVKFMPVCVPYKNLVLLSDSACNATGRPRSTGSSQLYMLIVGCVEDSYRQYLYGTQRIFIVMFPGRDGLHLCSEKDLIDARANLSESNIREVSSKVMLVFSLN